MLRLCKSTCYPAVLLICVALALVGCSSGNSNAYPPPDGANTLPYPPPSGSLISSPPVRTPSVSPQFGAIVARIYYAESGLPVRGQIFYAAPLLPVQFSDRQETGSLPSLHAPTAPRGESAYDGTVVISDVPPGRYTLGLLTPMGYYFLWGDLVVEETNFEVAAGQVTDIGVRTIRVQRELLEPQ